MGRPPRVDFPGAIHHVIARGVEKRRIFVDDRDRRRFLGILAECRPRFDFDVLAYCLMNNHVHLATRTGKAPLHLGMHYLLGSYAMSFNRRHRRIGHLFADRYKAFLIESERYLLTVVRYIHANPVRARMTDRPEAYVWSSDRAYREGGPPAWLDVETVLSTLGDSPRRAREAYRTLSAPEDVCLPKPHSDVVRGSRSFAMLHLARVGRDAVLADVTAEDVARSVAEIGGVVLQEIAGSGSRPALRARALVGLAARRIAGLSVAATAHYFGIAASSLSRGIQRLVKDSRPANLRREIEGVRAALCLRARSEARPQMHDRSRG